MRKNLMAAACFYFDFQSRTASRMSDTAENPSPKIPAVRKRHSGSFSSADVPYLPKIMKR